MVAPTVRLLQDDLNLKAQRWPPRQSAWLLKPRALGWGPEKLLSTYPIQTAKAVHLNLPSSTQGAVVPEAVIRVKIGMILTISDNVGHNNYLD
ncbi:hypothetical protein MJO28_010309 [Puccinia striiformis f. sp. tritici]|uniref:Uncharacterized protein n=4 Tax=Puccinia striiformis TaxID=27350 RepID=A0A0L0W2Z7_9BASI|nr:hypothetical protein MJO28_010309 [Puccinia striiformis f. sp. tritici]KAI9615453.1 hypothetical protein H4Q26_011392 [Puccinia striiformis f. sp. tritici PST-130]KNF05645.1 hypothetical protein PSTG_01048 [Puccinia striiformis f. sp. tritici PST-78]POW14036.1 hypothetical protein PSTT_03387 [Puccinia striiformis]POW21328.1 hypothetical protein PSHT_02565 [Puccinia striiformis]